MRGGLGAWLWWVVWCQNTAAGPAAVSANRRCNGRPCRGNATQHGALKRHTHGGGDSRDKKQNIAEHTAMAGQYSTLRVHMANACRSQCCMQGCAPATTRRGRTQVCLISFPVGSYEVRSCWGPWSEGAHPPSVLRGACEQSLTNTRTHAVTTCGVAGAELQAPQPPPQPQPQPPKQMLPEPPPQGSSA